MEKVYCDRCTKIIEEKPSFGGLEDFIKDQYDYVYCNSCFKIIKGKIKNIVTEKTVKPLTNKALRKRLVKDYLCPQCGGKWFVTHAYGTPTVVCGGCGVHEKRIYHPNLKDIRSKCADYFFYWDHHDLMIKCKNELCKKECPRKWKLK